MAHMYTSDVPQPFGIKPHHSDNITIKHPNFIQLTRDHVCLETISSLAVLANTNPPIDTNTKQSTLSNSTNLGYF